MDILQIIDSKLQVSWEPITSISQEFGEVVFHLSCKSTFSVPSSSFVWIA